MNQGAILHKSMKFESEIKAFFAENGDAKTMDIMVERGLKLALTRTAGTLFR